MFSISRTFSADFFHIAFRAARQSFSVTPFMTPRHSSASFRLSLSHISGSRFSHLQLSLRHSFLFIFSFQWKQIFSFSAEFLPTLFFSRQRCKWVFFFFFVRYFSSSFFLFLLQRKVRRALHAALIYVFQRFSFLSFLLFSFIFFFLFLSYSFCHCPSSDYHYTDIVAFSFLFAFIEQIYLHVFTWFSPFIFHSLELQRTYIVVGAFL